MVTYKTKLNLKTSQLPALVVLEGPNGAFDYLEMLPTKGRLGAFLNRISKPLRSLLNKDK